MTQQYWIGDIITLEDIAPQAADIIHGHKPDKALELCKLIKPNIDTNGHYFKHNVAPTIERIWRKYYVNKQMGLLQLLTELEKVMVAL